MSNWPVLYCPCGGELHGMIDTIGEYQFATTICDNCGLRLETKEAIEQVEAALMRRIPDYWNSSEWIYRLVFPEIET